MQFNRGSEWRKWDLHFHTPASYDYQNKGISNQEIIDNLIEAGIAVVAITDHHLIEVERVLELKELAQDRITILPGIEFRSELGGKESVHFIGIFPEDVNVQELWTLLQGTLNLTPSNIEKIGEEALYCDLKETAKIIHEFGGIVSVHAGRKSNSVENIKNTDLSKMLLKTDLLNESIDILEVNRVEDAENYRAIVFPSIGFELATITGSDNHNAAQYEPRKNCWINADPTFLGLKQVLIEPTDRIFIGDMPTKLKTVKLNQTKYVQSVKVHKESSTLEEAWFDADLQLNPGLVAVIGNKGSGKSALLDILGLLGNSHKQKYFSFLNSKQFCSPSHNKARHFISQLEWVEGEPLSRALDEDVDLQLIERVKYIPQNFFEEICNEIDQGEETSFDRELQNVIFSHVSEAKRLGCNSLGEIIEFRTREINQAIGNLKQRLFRKNHEIIELEEKLTNQYQQQLQSQLQGKEEELRVHDLQKPDEVKKPDHLDTEQDEAFAQIQDLKEIKQLITGFLDEKREQQKNSELQVSYLDRVKGLVQIFKRNYEEFVSDCNEYLSVTEIRIQDFVKIEVQEEAFEEAISYLKDENSVLSFLLEGNYEDSLVSYVIEIEKEIDTIEASLHNRFEEYQNYTKLLEEWNERRSGIIGAPGTVGSLNYYERLIKELVTIPEKLTLKKTERIEIVEEIYRELLKLSQIYRDLYAPVQEFISNHPLANDRLFLNFDVAINVFGIEKEFFDWISHGAGGAFSGREQGKLLFASILDKYDLNRFEDVIKFLDEVMDTLTQGESEGEDVQIEKQLKKGKSLESFYDYLFSLQYLKPRYILKLGDKDLNQLSPGEKGALLLIFYLLVDKDDKPLLIDQPEHNLDNQTVYDLLVPCIKEAKQKRQIIMVTHNPNLAVVCDAEQIICASLDKKNNYKLKYLAGSLEDPEINQCVVDILEGTKPAFTNREEKYQTI